MTFGSCVTNMALFAGDLRAPPEYLRERYNFQDRLGGGAYGEVWLAVDRKEDRRVAVKHIRKKFERWNDCLRLRECRVLSKMPPHRNLVKLFQLVHTPEHDLYFVFEYME